MNAKNETDVIDENIESNEDSNVSNDESLLLTKLEDQEKKTNEYLELSKKIQADFENYKKRVDKDILIYVFQKEKSILSEFISFRNVLEIASKNENNEVCNESIKSLISNYDNILKRLNVTKIKCLDCDFDYNVCECILKKNIEDKSKNNKVIEILEDGYLLNNKLLKPANSQSPSGVFVPILFSSSFLLSSGLNGLSTIISCSVVSLHSVCSIKAKFLLAVTGDKWIV
jgi:molecular chaperone GrpE